jgi:hypothetical protein
VQGFSAARSPFFESADIGDNSIWGLKPRRAKNHGKQFPPVFLKHKILDFWVFLDLSANVMANDRLMRRSN